MLPVIDDKVLFAVAAAVAAYLIFKSVSFAGRGSRIYEKELDRILNSDENKVKGRFE
ncbi:hypothetical protein HYU12_04400 [Candidatus Woesearchaeota archaeon]|nr:hypothetical protein [Candidatus Woesearchaeota archaeon]